MDLTTQELEVDSEKSKRKIDYFDLEKQESAEMVAGLRTKDS